MYEEKNKIIICIIICLVIVLINLFDYYYNQLPTVILKDNLTVTALSDVTNLSFIEKIEDGVVISKEEKIDTTSLGKKEIVIVIKNKCGKERKYKYFIDVINTN